MALDLQSLVPQFQALSPTRLAPSGDTSLERQRLELMRAQFENTKDQQARELQLRQLEEGGRMAREKMIQDRQREQMAAEQAAAAEKLKNDAVAKFTETLGGGDIQGAHAMVPLLAQLGQSVDYQGDVNGLPRYRIGPDLEGAQRANGAIGYPSDDTGQMQAPMGQPSTEEAFRQAQGATQQFEQTGQAARAPDQPDYLGAVPRNVIDMGAIHAATMASLNPALKSIVASYPQAYQESAQHTADAVSALPLSSAKSIETFDKLRGGPNSLIQAGIAAEAAAGQNAVKGQEIAGKDAHQRYKTGFNVIGKETANKFNVEGIIERQKTRAQAAYALSNDVDSDDYMAGASIARDMGEKGVLTEGDIKRTLGTASMSFLEKLSSGAYQQAVGGLSPEQKRALSGLIDQADKQDRKRAMSMLSNMDEVLDDPSTDKDTARGLKDYRRLIVPKNLRDEYESLKKKGRGGAAAEQPGAFNMEEDSKREYGTGGTQIPQTSRIAFEHNNPGNLKFVGQEGASQGEPAEDGGHWAKFPTVDAGLEALRQQVMHDAEAGMSIRDFIMKYAPPGSNDTETYIKQATAALKAQEGDSLAEVDPYDVVRFIAKKESGTEMPDQYSKSTTDPEARIRELQAKAARP